MSTTGDVENLPAEQPMAEAVPADKPELTGKSVKEKKAKAPKEKKPKKPKASPHPPYFQMIMEALLSLNEKSGSSPYAIAKYMEQKHKAVLPLNFRKILGLQLKNSVSRGKLIKIKASYKLSDTAKDKGAAKLTKAKKTVSVVNKIKPKQAAKPNTVTRSSMRSEAAKKIGSKKMKRTPAKRKQLKKIKSATAKKAKSAA